MNIQRVKVQCGLGSVTSAMFGAGFGARFGALVGALVGLVLALGSTTAMAQSAAAGFPNKPVRLIIAFTAGSATDIVGRALAAKLSDAWGQQVLAENRPGAGGTIGSALVAKSAPDGYTLLINSSAHANNPSMYAKLPYDTLKDFIDVGSVSAAPNVLIVASNAGIKSVADFIAKAKASAGGLNFAHAGVGSGTHFNSEKFRLATNIDFTNVPYKGSPEVMSDLISGRVTSYFSPIAPALPLIRDNKVIAVGVSSQRRSGLLPEVPAVAETVPGFEFLLWFGIWAPAGTPMELVNRISGDMAKVLGNSEMKETLAKLGNEPLIMPPPQFAAFVRREIEDAAKIIKAAGIKPQ